MASKEFKNQRFQETGAYEAPYKWIWLDHPTHSDWYNLEMVNKFAKAAKKHGVDPYDYIALGISESGLGNLYPSNPAMVDIGVHVNSLLKMYPELAEYKDVSESPTWKDRSIDFGAKYLSEQLKLYKDKLAGIQSYSGTGSTTTEPGKKWFGVKKENINFWKEKPHAKRVLDISRRLKAIPEIKNLISSQEPVRSKSETVFSVEGGRPTLVIKSFESPWGWRARAIGGTIKDLFTGQVPWAEYLTEEGKEPLKGEFWPTGTTTDPEKLKEMERELITGKKKISGYESIAKNAMSTAEWLAAPTFFKYGTAIAGEALPKVMSLPLKELPATAKATFSKYFGPSKYEKSGFPNWSPKKISPEQSKNIEILRKQTKGIIQYKPTVEEMVKGLKEGKITLEQVPERLRKFVAPEQVKEYMKRLAKSEKGLLDLSAIFREPPAPPTKQITPEMRRGVLEALKTSPSRSSIIGEIREPLEEYLKTLPPEAKAWVMGSMASKKELPHDFDLFVELPSKGWEKYFGKRPWLSASSEISSWPEKLHITDFTETTLNPRKGRLSMRQSFLKKGKDKYGPDYDWIRILTLASMAGIPISKILKNLPGKGEK